MLVDEVSHSFKKNYNYSNCPLKKRPFYYTSEDEEEAPEAIKGINIIFLLSHKSLWNYFHMKFNIRILTSFIFKHIILYTFYILFWHYLF